MNPSREAEMKVKLIEVGRSKKTWEAELPDGPQGSQEVRIANEARKALASSGVDAMFEEGGQAGTITAGFRPVGRFEILPS